MIKFKLCFSRSTADRNGLIDASNKNKTEEPLHFGFHSSDLNFFFKYPQISGKQVGFTLILIVGLEWRGAYLWYILIKLKKVIVILKSKQPFRVHLHKK